MKHQNYLWTQLQVALSHRILPTTFDDHVSSSYIQDVTYPKPLFTISKPRLSTKQPMETDNYPCPWHEIILVLCYFTKITIYDVANLYLCLPIVIWTLHRVSQNSSLLRRMSILVPPNRNLDFVLFHKSAVFLQTKPMLVRPNCRFSLLKWKINGSQAITECG
jgi:hypothetical protein